MTRKDYIRFAATFKELIIRSQAMPRDSALCARISIRANAETMCNIFGNDNPNFDRAKFLKACGVES